MIYIIAGYYQQTPVNDGRAVPYPRAVMMRAAQRGPWTLDSEPWILNLGSWTLDPGLCSIMSVAGGAFCEKVDIFLATVWHTAHSC